jgi:hypothetical protein
MEVGGVRCSRQETGSRLEKDAEWIPMDCDLPRAKTILASAVTPGSNLRPSTQRGADKHILAD